MSAVFTGSGHFLINPNSRECPMNDPDFPSSLPQNPVEISSQATMPVEPKEMPEENPEEILQELKRKEEQVIYQSSCISEANELKKQRQEMLAKLDEKTKTMRHQLEKLERLHHELTAITESDILSINHNIFRQLKQIIKEAQFYFMNTQQNEREHLNLTTKELIKLSWIFAIPFLLGLGLAALSLIAYLQHLFG